MLQNEKEIIIIDFNAGNPSSIQNMIKKAGYACKISNHPEDIEKATHLLMPGVGHFKYGMQALEKLKIIPLLKQKVVEENTFLLGICLGMQLLTEFSEEGDYPGLGWVRHSKTISLKTLTTNVKIPHMGWNYITPNQEHSLFKNLTNPRFYFVHSYAVVCDSLNNVLSETTYENQFTSSIIQNNILGVQFHPEKSHRFGLQLIKNFLSLS